MRLPVLVPQAQPKLAYVVRSARRGGGTPAEAHAAHAVDVQSDLARARAKLAEARTSNADLEASVSELSGQLQEAREVRLGVDHGMAGTTRDAVCWHACCYSAWQSWVIRLRRPRAISTSRSSSHS